MNTINNDNDDNSQAPVKSITLMNRKFVLELMNHIHENSDTFIEEMRAAEDSMGLSKMLGEILKERNNSMYTSGDLHLQSAMSVAMQDLLRGIESLMDVILEPQSSFHTIHTDIKNCVEYLEKQAKDRGVKIGV